MAKLTAKQQMFVKEYLIDLNATQAAIRAGYAPKRADAIGYENLRKPEIAAAVEEAVKARSEKLSVTAEDVVQSIIEIRGMALTEGELANALRANELLGRHLKMFTDKVEHSGGVEANITLVLNGVKHAP